MDRRMRIKLPSATNPESNIIEFVENMTENPSVIPSQQKVDQECQVNFYSNSHTNSQILICNQYIKDEIYDAETQTEILEDTRSIKIKDNKEFVNKECDTSQKIFVNQEIQADNKYFAGFVSIFENEQLIDLAGVTFGHFEFLLKKMCAPENCIVSKKDRLLIFLMKIKTGLTFSALSVLFDLQKTTISTIFFETLQYLADTTRNLVFWPSIHAVKETMPTCFHPQYSNTRVIIDCTKLKIEIPTTVDNRVFTYSTDEKNFIAKVLIGITPGGFICLKSKIAGGQKSDSQLTKDSELLDLLQDGDMVLANKSFPEIKTVIETSGKKLQMITPPFLEKKTKLPTEETQPTYNEARVRIHVDKIIQRLRTYQILNKIPENLFHCIDDIIHICCVLVNLQPPIISKNRNTGDSD